MAEAYVIDAVRTAVGKRNGSLAGVHPVDLGALGWRGLLDRVDVDPDHGVAALVQHGADPPGSAAAVEHARPRRQHRVDQPGLAAQVLALGRQPPEALDVPLRMAGLGLGHPPRRLGHLPTIGGCIPAQDA